jgi:hypothetical protein
VEAVQADVTVNGNGNGNGYANGNGNGNGNGASSSNGTSNLKVVMPAAATAAAAAAAPAAAAALAATANGSSNGKTAAATVTESERIRLLNTIDEEQNAEAAGQLELAAATAQYERKDRTAAGTPYKAPGGNWSKFKTYSVWQRTCEIWAFAISFAWRYFLLNQKWTYPKKAGGMTPEAVSARKKELAGVRVCVRAFCGCVFLVVGARACMRAGVCVCV